MYQHGVFVCGVFFGGGGGVGFLKVGKELYSALKILLIDLIDI